MIYAGCSGYSFREWIGAFYPPKTPAREFLHFYASRLNSVEINYTFRRFPKSDLVSSWSESTPSEFRFSLKMHQSVTHMARLRGVGASVRDFMDALVPLGNRLGVVLFQLPPFLRCELDRLDAVLAELPSGHRYAMEFRHESWQVEAVEGRLREAGVALCAAELEIDAAAEPAITAPFAYVRLRKTPPYGETEVEAARELVKRLSAKVEDVYVYVKHDEEGRAPTDVRRIAI
ncbi:MAG TPA: DUF72 domain-containing protein [Vicinamibacteria bacterium]|nr:DUF72 domain-containing protein [Vicinamibacteria bacterium]